MKAIKWCKLSSDQSYQVMKVFMWWKLSGDESYSVMKVIKWWKLKMLKLPKKWKRSDEWWHFACGDVLFNRQKFKLKFVEGEMKSSIP